MTLRILKKKSFKDKRGLLWTTWKKGEFNKIILIMTNFLIQKRKY